MPTDLLIALVSFTFIASTTPGPNNLMLMASGANYGFRRTVPHMIGVVLGIGIMTIIVGLGLSRLFEIYPQAYWVLTIFCVAYLLWLAWKIANAAAPEQGQATGEPFTFVQAALFQWVNPKAWTASMTAITLYASDRSAGAVITVGAVYAAVNILAVTAWSALGIQASRWLSKPKHLRAFNWTMALLLLGSLLPALAMIIA